MQKCIYCLKEKSKEEFNREHVIPEAIGTFENNLVLHNCVCELCNSYFANNLELFFNRDSMEALRRLQFGLKPLHEVDDLPLDRLSFSIATEGPWKGVRLTLRAEGDELVVDLLPQVGLAKKGGKEWIYLTERELADFGIDIPGGAYPNAGIRIYSPTEEVEKSLIDLLAERNIPFQKKGDLPPPPEEAGQVLTEGSYRFDHIIYRCVAKIAFNFMAWRAETAHPHGSDYMLSPEFDIIRNFIRWDKRPAYPLVRPSQGPLLYDDSKNARQTVGHLVTVNWSASGGDIVGQVSPFNEIKYNVSLARNFTGVVWDLRCGRCFDISTRKISELLGTSLTL